MVVKVGERPSPWSVPRLVEQAFPTRFWYLLERVVSRNIYVIRETWSGVQGLASKTAISFARLLTEQNSTRWVIVSKALDKLMPVLCGRNSQPFRFWQYLAAAMVHRCVQKQSPVLQPGWKPLWGGKRYMGKTKWNFLRHLETVHPGLLQ